MLFRTALWVGAVGAVAVFANTPVAVADPSDLVPVCSGGQTPTEDACSTGCPGGAPVESHGLCAEPGTVAVSGGPSDSLASDSGADPEVPLGTFPDEDFNAGSGEPQPQG
jgi:hypothetical protein